MSIKVYKQYHCDFCQIVFDNYHHRTITNKEIRNKGYEEGWERWKGEDICGDCIINQAAIKDT